MSCWHESTYAGGSDVKSGANSGAKYGSLNVFSIDSHKVAPSSTTPWPFVIASSADGGLTPLLSDRGCGLESECNNMCIVSGRRTIAHVLDVL